MTLNLLPALMALDYEIFLTVGNRGGELWPIVPQGVEVISLDTSSRLRSLWRLTALLRVRRPDVVISSSGRGNLLALWARSLARTPTKVIIREGGFLALPWYSFLRPIAAVAPLYRLFGRCADALVAVSPGVADALAHLTGVERRHVTVIDNPVIGPDFAVQASAPVEQCFFRPGGPPVFIGVGRLAPEKSFSTLIEAFAILRAGRESRLVIIGEGPCRGELEARCKALKIVGDVAFLGYQENPFAYMRRAAALVLPSLSEGFGNVLIEALSAGTQVIATDCSGPATTLEAGRFGLLVPPKNPSALAAAMASSLDAPIPLEPGRQRAAQFTVEAAAKRYAELIEACTPKRQAGGTISMRSKHQESEDS